MADPDWLAVEDVWQTYGTTQALRGVTLQIDRGEFVAFTGRSGSGKSTLLHIMSGLREPTRGHRTICGLRDPDPRQRALLARTQVAVVFQAFHLLPGRDAAANVLLGTAYQNLPAVRRRRIALDALGQVGLADRADHLPRELSGGEQQRVAIARALSADPHVILADEPTGNLDSAAGASVLDTLETLNANGRTIVLVTHSDDAAARAHRIVRLRDGQIDTDTAADGGR